MNLLLLDNYDSFTYNLYDYFLQAGAFCTVVRNDVAHLPDPARFDAIVFSPGPGKPEAAGRMMRIIAAFHQTKPMLGICLGHQALGVFFGARLVLAPEPVHGKTSRVSHFGHPLFNGIPADFEAMRYHSLLLENLQSPPLDCLAATAAGEIMALAHRRFPLYGVQFHPESILTEYGLLLLKNWIGLVFTT